MVQSWGVFPHVLGMHDEEDSGEILYINFPFTRD